MCKVSSGLSFPLTHSIVSIDFGSGHRTLIRLRICAVWPWPSLSVHTPKAHFHLAWLSSAFISVFNLIAAYRSLMESKFIIECTNVQAQKQSSWSSYWYTFGRLSLHCVRMRWIPFTFWHVYPAKAQISLWISTVWPNITKTRLYNSDFLKSHFYIVKLGFTGVYIIFSYVPKKHGSCYSLEPPRRGGSNEYPQCMFWEEIWNILENFFICKNFPFLVVKFSIYLNKSVFVMVFAINLKKPWNSGCPQWRHCTYVQADLNIY